MESANKFEESCRISTTISDLVIGGGFFTDQMSTKVKQTKKSLTVKEVATRGKDGGKLWMAWSLEVTKMEPLTERSSNYLHPGLTHDHKQPRRKSFSEASDAGGLMPPTAQSFPRRRSYVVRAGYTLLKIMNF